MDKYFLPISKRLKLGSGASPEGTAAAVQPPPPPPPCPVPPPYRSGRCPAGRNCQEADCLLLHPCQGRNCGHVGRDSDWLPRTAYSDWGDRRRKKTCKKLQEIMKKKNPKYNARTSARKAAQAKAADLRNFPDLCLSDAELQHRAEVGFQVILAATEADTSRRYYINVFLVSTGTEGNSIEAEGNSSTLTTRGHDYPALQEKLEDGTHRVLDSAQRRSIGGRSFLLSNEQGSKYGVKEVEKRVQLLVEEYGEEHGLEPLWRVAGAGGPKGSPPYKVGARLFPRIEPDGNLPGNVVKTF